MGALGSARSDEDRGRHDHPSEPKRTEQVARVLHDLARAVVDGDLRRARELAERVLDLDVTPMRRRVGR